MKKGLKKRKHTDIHDILKEVSEKVEKGADAKTVFGDPIRVGHRTIIPAATVSVTDKGKGTGGVHVESKPVGYIEITDEGAKFVPTVDQTKLALRGILGGLVAVGMFGLSSAASSSAARSE